MGIFDSIKNIWRTSPAKEHWLRAQKHFQEKENTDALRALSAGFQADVDYKPLYDLAIATVKQMGGGDEVQLFEKVLTDFKDAKAFNDLGVFFHQQNHYDLALIFLEKAAQINPYNTDNAHDLAIVYARRFKIPAAIKVLNRVDLTKDFWANYFLQKCKILVGDYANVEANIRETNQILQQEKDPKAKVAQQKYTELVETIDRFKVDEQPKLNIRDWQFIQYGSIILNIAEELSPAGGRYVAASGTNESIKTDLARLEKWCKSLNMVIETVGYLPNQESEIIARAIALQFDLPCVEYKPDIPASKQLIVAANSADFNDYPALQDIQLGQILFAYTHDWLNSCLLTPDIIGLMAQQYRFPWQVSFKINAETEQTSPPTRAEIAMDIFDTKVDLSASDSGISFYKKRANLLKAKSSSGYRYNFMVESPVSGSRFD